MKIVGLDEIRSRLDVDVAIAAVRDGFVGFSAGKVELAAIGHLTFPDVDGDCHIKSASMSGSDVFVVKIASGFPRNPRLGLRASDGLMIVLDTATGSPLGLLLDEGHLTDFRTAIAGGLAAALVRPADCPAIGIVGTGIQARLQAELVARATSIKQVVIWGRDAAKASSLAEDLNAVGLTAEPVADIETLCRRTRLVITTTPARAPLLTRANTVPGMRIVAVGADAPGKQEVESELVGAMDLLVADSSAQCLDHGELSWSYRSGDLDPSRVIELGQLLADPPSLDEASSALVDLTGLGIQDLQIAAAVWRSLLQA